MGVADQQAPQRLVRAARTDRQLLARSSITFVSRAIAKFAQIFFLVVAARLLTVDEFASYSYLIVLASAFTIMSDTGVPLVAGRDASSGQAQLGELFWSALPIVLVSAVVAAVLLPIFGAFDAGPGSSFAPVMIAAAFVVFNRLLDLIGQLLRGVGRFEFEAALQLGGAVAFIAGAIVVTAAGYGATAVILVLCLKELVCCIVGLVAIRSDLGRPRGAHAGPRWRGLLRIGIRLSVAGIALALAMRIPLAVLGNTGSAAEVAYFSAAQRFGDAAYVLAITGGFALLPGIAYLAKAEPDRAAGSCAGCSCRSSPAASRCRSSRSRWPSRSCAWSSAGTSPSPRTSSGSSSPACRPTRSSGCVGTRSWPSEAKRGCSRWESPRSCCASSCRSCSSRRRATTGPRGPTSSRSASRRRSRMSPSSASCGGCGARGGAARGRADREDADGGRAVSDAAPRVSVILPAYNAEGAVRRAIDSVLAQTMPDFELLVIDDGSEDGTGDVVRAVEDARIRYVRRPHAGLPQTLNAGLAEARAPVVAVQDADDWSAPQRLERQLAVLDARAEVAVVGSRMPEVDADGRELTARAPFEAGDAYHVLMRFNPISNPSSAYRREVVAALGGYDRRYGCAPEYDLWLRVSDRHVVLAVDEPLAIRTLDGTNLSTVRERTCIRDTIHMRVRAMRRRRSLRGLGSLLRVVASYLLPTQVKHARRRRRGQAI